VANSVLTSLY